MRTALAFFGVSCLALIIAVPALADTVDAPSKIDAVTVFPDAAGITRIADIEIPQGASTIVFKGLPMGIDPASLRISGEGSAKLTIGAVEQRIVPAARPTVDNSLEARIKSLQESRAQLQVSLDALERRRAMIVRFSEAGPEKLSPESKPLEVDKWNAAWDAVGSAMAKVGEDLRAGRRKALDLDAEIASLEMSRMRPEAGRRGPVRDVVVLIEAEAAGKAHLTLKYRIGGASWQPLYDARLDTGGDTKKPIMEFVRRAAITQQTGEDWSDVSLEVSTVRTDRGTQVPDIQPLLIAFQPPPEIVYDEAVPNASGRLYRKRAAPAAAPPAPIGGLGLANPKTAEKVVATEAKARIESNAYQASFHVAGRITVPADGAQKSFQLGAKTIEPTLLFKTVPSLDPTAYLDAAFTNTDEAPLLPGDVTLVRDGTFVGSGHVGLVAPGDKIDLGFGADDRVKVVRVPVKRRENDPVWIGSNKVEANEFKTTVKNLHDFPVKVTILDQIPISETTTIVVDKLPATTPPTEKMVADKRGVMSWTYDIAPGATKEVHIAWRSRWPADSEVVMTNAPVQAH